MPPKTQQVLQTENSRCVYVCVHAYVVCILPWHTWVYLPLLPFQSQWLGMPQEFSMSTSSRPEQYQAYMSDPCEAGTLGPGTLLNFSVPMKSKGTQNLKT